MTTDITTTTANKVIVVGMLDTMLVRDRSTQRDKETGRARLVPITLKEARNRGKGGLREELTIQVRSPYGGMFAMKIELEPDVPGAELLESAEAETLLAFEGTLQLKQTFDPFYASDQQDYRGRIDRGRPTRALQILVRNVREPNEQERRASSAVWLEGVVAEPPQVSRHPDLPSMQLAGTIIRVAYARPADFPGLQATIEEAVEINVAVSTTYANAEVLYRPGNTVRIVGQLDCRLERQAGPSVQGKLTEIDAQWAETKASLVGKPADLRRAENTYRRQRMRIEEAPRLFVLALAADLLAGEPIALADTYQMRRDFVRTQRQQREARRQRVIADQQRRAASATPRPEVAEGIGDMPLIASAADVGVDPAAGTTRTARPRRRVEQSATEIQPLDSEANHSSDQPDAA